MRIAPAIAFLTLPLVASAAEPPSTYAGVAAVVAAAERGGMTVDEAQALIEAAPPETPLAAAALGRLHILKSHETPFVMLRFLEARKGFAALNAYIAEHRGDPLPRVWRGASAVETNFVLWSVADARRDLEAACELCRGDPSLPDCTAHSKLLLGTIAKDEGDLERALRLWAEAFAADPTGPYGRKAATFLKLFTG
jgi:hypothetical protein